MNVTVYTTPTCGYCHQAKKYLSERGVKYTEHDVSRDKAAADEMVRLTGQMGVPVIVVDGKPIIGFDRPRLESLLAKGGGNGSRPRFGLRGFGPRGRITGTHSEAPRIVTPRTWLTIGGSSYMAESRISMMSPLKTFLTAAPRLR